MAKFSSGSNNKKRNNPQKLIQTAGLIQKPKNKFNKKDKKFKKQVNDHLTIQDKNVTHKTKKLKVKKLKKKSTFEEKHISKNKTGKKNAEKNKLAMKYSNFGDISEEDIDSDDDLSMDESELPVPPDVTSSEDESSEETEPEESPPIEIEPEEDIEKRTLFVGNLPKSVNRVKVKKWFANYGTVECVRLRCAPLSDPEIPKKRATIKKEFHDDRTNINAFVRFSTVEEATKALSANGKPFDESHHLMVDMAGKTGQQKKYDDKKAIFIGNLPFGAEENELRDHFADCGDIVGIRIIRDKFTAVGKGFAYINFASRHSVRLALEKDAEIRGRKIRIQKAMYNKDVEIVKVPPKKGKPLRKGNKKENQGPTVIMKIKKNKKTNEEPEFQGLSSKKKMKRKKLSNKKKKIKHKKEKIKKILNTNSKKK